MASRTPKRHPGGRGDRRSRDPAIRDLAGPYEIPDAMVPDPTDRHRSGMTYGGHTNICEQPLQWPASYKHLL